MRPGYDRVYSDVRRPMIPDLPVSNQNHSMSQHDEGGRTATVLGALFAVVLTIAGGIVIILGPS